MGGGEREKKLNFLPDVKLKLILPRHELSKRCIFTNFLSDETILNGNYMDASESFSEDIKSEQKCTMDCLFMKHNCIQLF